VADEQPAQQRHRERLDQPVDEQRHADAPQVLTHPRQRAEVHLQQHGDDHHPDEQAHRQVDPRHLQRAHGAGRARQPLAERNARHDAQQHPHGEVALEHRHAGGRGGL